MKKIRFKEEVPMAHEKFTLSRYDDLGREIPCKVSKVLPYGASIPESLEQMIKRIVVGQKTFDDDFETFEEFEDFDIDDDDGLDDFSKDTPWEEDFEGKFKETEYFKEWLGSVSPSDVPQKNPPRETPKEVERQDAPDEVPTPDVPSAS